MTSICYLNKTAILGSPLVSSYNLLGSFNSVSQPVPQGAPEPSSRFPSVSAEFSALLDFPLFLFSLGKGEVLEEPWKINS